MGYLVKALVDHPEHVSLKRSELEGACLLELKVAPEDIGKVIGRDGRTVSALRTLINAATAAQGQKVRLEILDDRRTAQVSAPSASSPDAL